MTFCRNYCKNHKHEPHELLLYHPYRILKYNNVTEMLKIKRSLLQKLKIKYFHYIIRDIEITLV